MLLLSTLGNWFPRVWENDRPKMVTYFKTEYKENREIMQNFNAHYSSSNPQYAFARYCEYNGRNKPYKIPAQDYLPSIICIYEMGVAERIVKKGFDLEIAYSVLFKVTEREIANMINAIETASLMHTVNSPVLDEYLDAKLKRM